MIHKKRTTKVPNGLLIDPRLRPADKLIAIYILSFRRCFASQKFIGNALGFSRSTVQRSVERMVKLGVLETTKAGGHSVFYRVTFDQPTGITERPLEAQNGYHRESQ